MFLVVRKNLIDSNFDKGSKDVAFVLAGHSLEINPVTFSCHTPINFVVFSLFFTGF